MPSSWHRPLGKDEQGSVLLVGIAAESSASESRAGLYLVSVSTVWLSSDVNE